MSRIVFVELVIAMLACSDCDNEVSSLSSEDTDDAEEDDGDAARADAACDVVSESELSSEETMAVRTLRERFRFGRRIALSTDPISVEIVENRILHARKTWEI